MYLCHVVIIIYMIVSVQAERYTTISDHFLTDSREPTLIVREGMKVTLLCPKDSGSVIYITFANYQKLGEGFLILIDSSNMTDISNKYGLNETNDSTYAFTINSISRDDEGVYRCVQGLSIRSRTITVTFSPSGSSPQCSSNYKSPSIFYDELTDDFLFNCFTERGKPSVTTKIYVNEQEVTSDLEITNETRTDKETILTTYRYSLFRHFNDTLHNREFVCNVTQELPSPYDDYQGSCSFGPLYLLPGVLLSISPSYVTVREERNVTLTCTSNVTGVNITWINIPSEKYIVSTDYNRSSVLTILSFKPASHGTIVVECSGSYRSRTVTTNTTLFLMFNEEEPEDENYKEHANVIFIMTIIIVVSLGCVVATVFSVEFIRRNKGQNSHRNPAEDNSLENTSMSNRHEEQRTLSAREESNMNNANNTALCRDYDGMCDNIIYEPAISGTITEFVEDEKIKSCENSHPCFEVGNYASGDDHVICENVIYQSVSYANKKGRNTTDLTL